MDYFPQQLAAESLRALAESLQRELQSISQAINDKLEIRVKFLNVAPGKRDEGMIVGADGTNWNPGGGKGLYQLQNGSWIKL